MRKPLQVLVFLLIALLAGCSSGPPVRVFPPQASLQELRVQDDGQWVAQIRLQNYSTVPMRFSQLEARLDIGGVEATRINVDPGLTVGPGSIELLRHVFMPAPGPKAAVIQALADKRAVRYQLSGRLVSSDLGTDDPIEYQSALNPVPGLAGVLR